MDIKAFGEQSILVNFEQKIDLAVHAKVMALKRALEHAPIEGIQYFIPAYCSLNIGYDPAILDIDSLKTYIQSIDLNQDILSKKTPSRLIKIPVCYEAPFSLDMEEISTLTGLTSEKIIHLHTSTNFHVYMLGFLPGFAYMGTLPKALECPRKSVPRRSVPVGAVGLAGQQTGIYPSKSPGGWQIIGQTPITIFDAQNDQPFLFQVGDEVRFFAITQDEFNHIKSQ